MRPIPEFKTAFKVPDKAPARSGYVTQVREYELITPLFGGGVEPGLADPVTVIRATEIRGHLRFWWRATRGGQFDGDLQKMKEAEDKLWGAANTDKKNLPSEVVVRIVESQKGEEDRPFEIIRGKAEPRQGSLVPAYIAFALQPTSDETRERKPTKAVQLNVKFKLAITFRSEHRHDVEAALWAWETFGGVGARTRRGFGALCLKAINENEQLVEPDLPSDTNAVKAWIQRKLGDDGFQVKGKWPENVPRLPAINRFKFTRAQLQQLNNQQRRGERDIIPENTRGLEVLTYLSEKLKLFRQSRYNKYSGIGVDNAYGLSRWPEAEEIRHRLGIRSRSEATKGIHKFPRAKLGLPINFHLYHDDEEIELTGKNTNRRASPLIFRPLVCADGKVVGVALILAPESLPPEGLQLKGIANNSDQIDVEPGADLYKIQPMRREKDIFKAFLDTL